MTLGVLTAVLGTTLVASALAGPWLLRQAAPALVRVPRLAIVVIGGAVVAWLGTLLAIGPVLAWTSSGPAMLPDGTAAVCQRCLDAANPFPGGTSDSGIPALLLLALPTVLVLALGTGLARQLRRRDRGSRQAARQLLDGAPQRRLQGQDVWVVDAEHPFALTFPARHGGIVVSSAAVHALDDEELAAVLAHERAHLRQRHHLITTLAAGTAALLRRVPLVAAATEALPHYLEIAADDQARRRAGTPALVSALLKLAEHARPAGAHPALAAALHATGPARVRQLVEPGRGLAGAVPALLLAAHLVVLVVAAAAVHLPYASAALSGCA